MELNVLRTQLGDDMAYHTVILENNRDNMIIRRSYIRAVFSYIEGIVNGLKLTTLEISQGIDGVKINEEKKHKLKNTRFCKKRGKEIDSYPSTKENLSLALNEIAVQHECNYRLNNNGKAWDNYLNSLKIRDAVTHPKKMQDLKINDEKLEMVELTYKWFMNELKLLEQSIHRTRLNRENVNNKQEFQ